MSNRAPRAIFTDRDKRMQKAIGVVVLESRHRWRLWHIMKKLLEKFGSSKMYQKVKHRLQLVIYDSLNKEEFEEKWEGFIKEFNLFDNAWLNSLYEERHRWVPAFVKDTFWAGMSTTQRCESMNAFFDDYVNSKTTLGQFVEQYGNALRDKIKKENLADFQSFNSFIPCVTHFGIEKQFQLVYTHAKFKKLQMELTGKLYCDVFSVDAMNGIFKVVETIFFEDEEKK